MSDFTSEQIDQLTRALELRRQNLLHASPVVYPDNDDEPTVAQREPQTDPGGEVTRMLAQHELEELTQIRQALARLSEGRYGSCVDCGMPIRYARLLAEPHATRCIDCQRLSEARHA
jgi:RNA polymerase-binding transcription factor DksA